MKKIKLAIVALPFLPTSSYFSLYFIDFVLRDDV